MHAKECKSLTLAVCEYSTIIMDGNGNERIGFGELNQTELSANLTSSDSAFRTTCRCAATCVAVLISWVLVVCGFHVGVNLWQSLDGGAPTAPQLWEEIIIIEKYTGGFALLAMMWHFGYQASRLAEDAREIVWCCIVGQKQVWKNIPVLTFERKCLLFSLIVWYFWWCFRWATLFTVTSNASLFSQMHGSHLLSNPTQSDQEHRYSYAEGWR